MFGLRKTIGSILMVVVFLALASLAAFFYNTDQKQKEEVANNDLIKKGKIVLGTLVGVSETAADVNLQKNIGVGKTIADYAGRVDWKGLIQGTGAVITDSSTQETNLDDLNSDFGANQEAGQKENLAASASENANSTGFWSRFSALIKKEWSDSQNDSTLQETDQTELIADNALGQSSFDYQKTEIGVEIIFRGKSGQEYKLPLPFKFLTKF